MYNLGYGLSFVKDVTRLMHHTRENSVLKFNTNSMRNIKDLLIDGTIWMVRYKSLDKNVFGRSISRPYISLSTDELSTTTEQMMEIIKSNPDIDSGENDIEKLNEFNEHINCKNLFEDCLIETHPFIGKSKYFWRSDYLAHHRFEFFASLSMVSSRTFSTESFAGENLKGFWLPFGTTLFYVLGNEYSYRPAVSGWLSPKLKY